MNMLESISLVVVWQAASVLALLPQPDVMPSIHPVTGPSPPQVPAPPRGSSRPLNPPSNSVQTTSQPSQGIGKYWTGWQGVQKLFAFGDSYTTTGFQPDMAQPSPEFPLGNPAYPGATSSNGPNYIDFLTTTYNQTLVETYNLAYGGATVDSDIVPCYLPTVPDYRQQVNTEFMPYYVDENAANSDWTPQNSLFITFFGINDVTNSYSAQNTTINGDILTVYSGLVGQLYNAGARNFLFMNVPPVNLSPGTVMNGASAQALESADITNFNNQIAQVASTYSTYPDATVFLYDTNAMFSHVLKNPTSFQQTAGYVNTTTYCTAYANGTPAEDSFDPSCGVPVNQYFWLNTLHPTYPMHDVVAQTIVGQLEYGSCLGC